MIVVSYFDPLQLKAKSYEERQQSHRILKPRIDHCRLRKLIRKLVFMGNFASFTVNKLEVQHFTIICTGLMWKERPLITVVNLYFTIIRSLLQKYIWHPKNNLTCSSNFEPDFLFSTTPFSINYCKQWNYKVLFKKNK